MYSTAFYSTLLLFTIGMVQPQLLDAQYNIQSNSWKETQEKKQGSITALWYDIEPFIYRNDNGGIIGVEYELMEGFKPFLKKTMELT